jgi:8-oxo-dGTP diphosphatase
MLASYGRCQVMSSEAERCLATVRPYAQAVGAQVRAEPAFTIVPGAISPPEVLAAAGRDALRTQNGRGGVGLAGVHLARELATSGVPTLICAHRENLPAIIDAAFTALGASPPDDQPLGKSEFWVLHSAQASLAGVERHGLTALARPRESSIVGGRG